MIRSFALVCLLGLTLPVFAQPATQSTTPLSERRVAYTIDATLDPEARTVRGRQRLAWRNPDKVPVDTLQFHLYLNAFKDEHSTFMKEGGASHRGYRADHEDRWGHIQISRMQVVSPDVPLLSLPATTNNLAENLTFIQPDDQNPNDQTVAQVVLPQAVQPGETVYLDIDFESKLPEIVARTGWDEKEDGTPFFMVAQWFPKIAVYEIPGQRYIPTDAPRGRWNAHQFHANSEFYADFGTYDVTVSVPKGYRIGASGVRVSEQREGDTQTFTYRAEDVHDFAWTASPAFLEYTDTWRHVNLRLLIQPEHQDQAKRHFDAAKAALEHFDAWVGEYPYTTLTLVDGLGGSNGMEYPTLITCGTFYKLPTWFRPLELVTIHEFGHQYFYGLLASNEFEEAWLDEGMNSYVETRIMDKVYGQGSVLDFPGFRLDDGGVQRLAYTKNNPSRGALYTWSWQYPFGDYSKASYSKPATVMNTLERHLGWETMQQFLRTYYQRWRFRHPTTRDLADVAEEVSGQDLDWFFDQFVYGTAVVDYAVSRIRNQRIEDKVTPDTTQTWYKSTVRLERKADGIFPQTIRVRFDDGSTEDLAWDGTETWKEFSFEKPVRLAEAHLDPDNKVWLDTNRLNNRKIYRANNTLAWKVHFKLTTWLQQIFFLLASLF